MERIVRFLQGSLNPSFLAKAGIQNRLKTPDCGSRFALNAMGGQGMENAEYSHCGLQISDCGL
jgi:hypothetical protein